MKMEYRTHGRLSNAGSRMQMASVYTVHGGRGEHKHQGKCEDRKEIEKAKLRSKVKVKVKVK